MTSNKPHGDNSTLNGGIDVTEEILHVIFYAQASIALKSQGLSSDP